jgi:hypothetical protein
MIIVLPTRRFQTALKSLLTQKITYWRPSAETQKTPVKFLSFSGGKSYGEPVHTVYVTVHRLEAFLGNSTSNNARASSVA